MLNLLTTFIVSVILSTVLMTSIIVILKYIIVITDGGRHLPLTNRLKELRARHNLSQTELGNMVNVSRQTISLIERGDYNPSVSLAIKISRVLQSTVEELFCYTEDQ